MLPPESSRQSSDPNLNDPFPWHLGIQDAHVHMSDPPTKFPLTTKTRSLCIMSVRHEDQVLLDSLAREHGPKGAKLEEETRVVPGFGWHPWFSHLLWVDSEDWVDGDEVDEVDKIKHYTSILSPQPDHSFAQRLETPIPLTTAIARLRTYLVNHPLALVGEVGIDKAYRLPDPVIADGQSKKLSKYRVSMAHQKAVLVVQLRLAGEMGRGVSVHGVQAHGALFEVFGGLWKGYERGGKKKEKKKVKEKEIEGKVEEVDVGKNTSRPFPPRICLHSYSGSLELLKMYFRPEVPSEMYISVCWLNNFETSETARARTEEVVRWIPETSLLVESDWHGAGDEADELMEKVTREVCRIRGWGLEEGVGKMGRNWWRFATGFDRDVRISEESNELK